ncbi:thioredoxin family protein [Actinomadura sp. 21ATH]|uniref:thioredoxin family protein n=1 Tax=Actinomadura sp. 21ATH TaxID=1735444 RepID=UPI0035BF56E3
MATVELTKDRFDETVDGDGLVLIDFWAGWCAPCRSFAPVYERVSEKHPDVVFAKVDTESEPELAAAFEVTSIPTLAIVRDRMVLFAQAGALPENALEDLISQAEALDMDEVRRRAD